MAGSKRKTSRSRSASLSPYRPPPLDVNTITNPLPDTHIKVLTLPSLEFTSSSKSRLIHGPLCGAGEEAERRSSTPHAPEAAAPSAAGHPAAAPAGAAPAAAPAEDAAGAGAAAESGPGRAATAGALRAGARCAVPLPSNAGVL